MRSGFVYVFSNPGLSAYKIGMTTRALRLRADELHREYGVTTPNVKNRTLRNLDHSFEAANGS